MNQSTVTARAVVQALIDGGVRDVVVSPGSRSAGLAYAAAQAQQAGCLKLHVHIDEREAGFLALGLSKTSRLPVAVIVTSGTAVANLMPAVVEANMAGVALVAVTADRPERLRFRGAAQTINQPPLFQAYVASVHDVAVDEDATSITRAALLAASGHARHQPVHINVQFELPLMPEDGWSPTRGVEVTTDVHSTAPEHLELPPHGVVVVGDVTLPQDGHDAARFAEKLNWPLVWEPSSNAHAGVTAIAHGALFAHVMPKPDAVITIGTVGLSRSVTSLLSAAPEHVSVHLASNGPTTPDPTATATQVIAGIPSAHVSTDTSWLQAWRSASSRVSEVVQSTLAGETLSAPAATRALWEHLSADAHLFVGASWAVRHVEAYAPTRSGVTVSGNRGANGLDGALSTAIGPAYARRARTYALIGDVTFLYGAGGLTGASGAPLTVVVLDNDGSGIFGQLEQAGPEYRDHYELVFGTPHGLDLWAVAESHGVPAQRVTTVGQLKRALTMTDGLPGLHVIVCATGSRQGEADLVAHLASAAISAVS